MLVMLLAPSLVSSHDDESRFNERCHSGGLLCITVHIQESHVVVLASDGCWVMKADMQGKKGEDSPTLQTLQHACSGQ